MRRRAFLAGAALAGLSGCLDAAREAVGRSTTDSGDALAAEGFPPSVCEESIDPDFPIRAIASPAFAPDWNDHAVDEKYATDGPGLADDQAVVGLWADGRARAYPLSVLWWHEVVNDSFDGPVVVTYCPICRSGVVAERRVAGETTRFGVSGLLWQPPSVRALQREQEGATFGAAVDDPDADLRNRGNLVLYDEATRSYWSQILARAICGPRTGDELDTRGATVTTWGEWRDGNPGTDVLLPPPHSTLL